MRNFLFNSVYYFCICCIAFLIPFGLTACSNDEFADYKYENDGIKSFTSFTATIGEETITRAYLGDAGVEGKKRMYWNERDEIAVFSDADSDFKTFKVTSVSGDNKATIQGEKVSGTAFYGYYPNRDANLALDKDNPKLLHASLSANDFDEGENTQTPMVAISNSNNLAFKQVTGMIHVSIGGIYRLEKVTLSGNDNEVLYGNGTIDLSVDEPVFKLDNNQDGNKSLGGAIRQGDEQLLGDGVAEIYFSLPSMTLAKGFTLEIKGYDESGKSIIYKKSTEASVVIKRAQINHYTLANVMEELNTQGNDEIIEFADENVKTICVANWDTNGDGALSRAEAAAVTDIGQVFKYNTDIASFNEFRYFTGVTSIGDWAFFGCSLTSIVIPESVTSIGDAAFAYCSSLTSIEVDKNNRYYDSRNDCNAIIETNSNTLIAGCASTVIPASVTSIGFHAFYYCSSLTSIEIPEGVTSIGDGAFNECSSLTSIVIPAGVTSIGHGVFYYCSSLTSIEIPEGVTSIANDAFAHCSSLTSIEIPEGVTSIGDGAFNDCSSLTSIVIPAGVTSIGYGAFYGCSSLTSIEIPEGVTSIGHEAFAYCSGLTSIEVDKNNLYYDSRNDCNAIIETNSNTLIAGCASTVIPAGVTSIGNNAFYGCSSLTSMVIPEGVTSIGNNAFLDCSSLNSFTCLATNPPVYNNIFAEDWGHSYSGTIYVPAASVDAYKAADGWKEYASQIFQEGNIGFADNNVKAICVQNWDTNGDGELSYAEAAAVTDIGSVFKDNVDIVSFNEFQYFTGVTSIGNDAFFNCKSLTSIVIPEGVTSIGDAAFWGCISLTSFTCLATNPPIYNNIFLEVWGHSYFGAIYVPAASVDAYKAADGWEEYASQIQAIQE